MRKPRNKRRCAGFTLIEVLVALLVLSIGLLGLAGLQATSVRQNHGAYLRSQASLLAYDMLDRMRGNRSEAEDGGAYDGTTFDDVSDLPASPTTVASNDIATWGAAVLNLLPAASASIAVDADDIVTINIGWDDSRAEGTATNTTFTFETRL